MRSEILTFIKNNNDWEEKLKAEPYNLRIARKDSFAIFNYFLNPNFSLSIVQEARGIILDIAKMKVVCFPFSKFFNYNESFAHTINWETAKVQEKLDGSLIKFWFNEYTNNWHISTNKTIDARDASVNERISFYDLVTDAKNDAFNYFLESADKRATHMFELTSPINRIVIEYSEPQLWYLGSRTNETGEEYFDPIGLLRPKFYSLNSMEECLSELSNGANGEIEGFVVVDNNFNRVKIKTEHYVKMARLRCNGNLTTKRILNIIQEGEKDEFLAYFPNYKNWFNDVEHELKLLTIEIMCVCKSAETYYKMVNESRKELAIEFQNNPYFLLFFHTLKEKKLI